MKHDSRHDSPRQIEPHDIASLFHTGDTTGMANVAPHTHANEVFLAWSVAATGTSSRLRHDGRSDGLRIAA
jgi:acyl-CoA synthetase (AMP-forming)/AMP-acid ligase II